MKKLYTLALAFLCLGSTYTFAQRQWEVGAFAGLSNYGGDLQQTHFELATTNPAQGLFLRYHLSPAVSFKLAATRGVIEGADANYSDLLIRQRNLSFRSDITEAALTTEIALGVYGAEGKRTAAPYFFAGVGVFNFNPQTLHDGQWVDLQPLGTEGQGSRMYPGRNPYKLTQVSVPLGIGFNFRIQQRLVLGYEFGYRHTFTDYLDDIGGTYPDVPVYFKENPLGAGLSYREREVRGYVSDGEYPTDELRGDEANDHYFFGGFTVSWLLGK